MRPADFFVIADQYEIADFQAAVKDVSIFANVFQNPPGEQ
jgi:hypothetical protein